MRTALITAGLALTMTATGLVAAGSDQGGASKSIEPDQLGLSKVNPMAHPTPEVYGEDQPNPGSSKPEAEAFPGAPTLIPHAVAAFTPIRKGSNSCLGCHHNPSLWDKEPGKGMATPIPRSHYTDLRKASDEVRAEVLEGYTRVVRGEKSGHPKIGAKDAKRVVGAYYQCTQCHAPKTDAKPLVDNTFGEE